MRKKSSIVLALLMLMACADVKRKEQLSELDALASRLSNIEHQLETYRCDTLDQLLVRVKRVDSLIRRRYDSDTVSLEFAQKLDGFKFMLADLKELEWLQQELDRDLGPQRKALTDLREDVSNGSGKTLNHTEYIRFERNQVAALQELTDSLIVNRKRSFEDYDELYNEIRDYALELGEVGAED